MSTMMIKLKVLIISFTFLHMCTVSQCSKNLKITCSQAYRDLDGKFTLVKNRIVCKDFTGTLKISDRDEGGVVAEVVSASGDPISTQSMRDYEALSLKGSNELEFMPRGIVKKFHRLKVMGFESCGLKYLSKEDMQQFGNQLEALNIWNNKIERIEEDLFDYNKNLVYISFMDNPLMSIGSDILNHLKKLPKLEQFNLNGCDCTQDVFERKTGQTLDSFQWNLGLCFLRDDYRPPRYG